RHIRAQRGRGARGWRWRMRRASTASAKANGNSCPYVTLQPTDPEAKRSAADARSLLPRANQCDRASYARRAPRRPQDTQTGMLASMAKRKRTTEIVCPGCRRGGRENALTARERTRLPEEHERREPRDMQLLQHRLGGEGERP